MNVPKIKGFYTPVFRFTGISLLEVIHTIDSELDRDGDFKVEYYDIFISKSKRELIRKSVDMTDFS